MTYIDYEENEMYVCKDDLDSFKISQKQIQFADVLAEGRFAVVRRAYYLKGDTKEAVAAKALKSKKTHYLFLKTSMHKLIVAFFCQSLFGCSAMEKARYERLRI
jgi:hypothetical protein